MAGKLAVQLLRPTPKANGMLVPGNVDLYGQPSVPNPIDGGMSTVYSRGYDIDGGRYILLPSVTPDGRFLSTDDEVWNEYHRGGRHLGIFSARDPATEYADQLHNDYAAGKYAIRPGAAPLPKRLKPVTLTTK